MRSYWNKPEETKLAFRNGFFRTGDIGYQDANGYFYILDRLKDMIVTGGENVYSGEVEALIYTHPAVREVAVFGIPDPKWGEIVKACVVLKPGKTLTADELIAYCRRSLANFKVPRSIEFSQTELPKSGSGQILKRVLREDEFVVYGNDHRGHGLTAKPSDSFGDFGPADFNQLVEDMVSLRVIAKNEYRGRPYILLGHGMGSFAAQQFVLDHGHSIDGL